MPAFLPLTCLPLYLALVCLHFLKGRFTMTTPEKKSHFISSAVKSNVNRNFFMAKIKFHFGYISFRISCKQLLRKLYNFVKTVQCCQITPLDRRMYMPITRYIIDCVKQTWFRDEDIILRRRI